ncbi:conserved hypothetical protein [Alkalilimnicola ehrlichii MLHE-1]|uniref:Aminoglycoside phosphotransferase domain-containing protein n=2 Tax=Alkalilimnicola ehrlichii TaxID=351052 RepID=Q0A7V9_ALKEH|nr:conserved hypothetical protein [Alkalilimnicola ehrlichii MLHE-1]
MRHRTGGVRPSEPGDNSAPMAQEWIDSPSDGPGPVPLRDKVAFLADSDAYPDVQGRVTVRETHMSWVFLAGDRVYKLKKPLRYPRRDGRFLWGREFLCREEVRLNRRLAPDVYLGVSALTVTADGRLALQGGGRTVDWLVVMRRLPAERMLDNAIAAGAVDRERIDRLGERLSGFYRGLAPEPVSPQTYLQRFAGEHARNRAVLTDPRFALPKGALQRVLDALDRWLEAGAPALRERARAGRIVEGHGDLRPEHVCLCDTPVVIDGLEFSLALRQVDPFDELAFLGMECDRLGAPWIGPRLIRQCGEALDDHPGAPLLAFYTAYRACLRARLALAHLLEPDPRSPERWVPLAADYLSLAERAAANLGPPATR